MAGATPEKISAFKRLAVKAAAQGRRRRAGLRHAARRQVWPRRAVRRRARRRTSGSPSRSSFRARVRCASSSARGRRQPAGRMAGRPLPQGALLLSPRRSGRPQGRRRSRSSRAAYEAARKVGRELLIEIICLASTARWTTRRPPRALTELYDAGLKPDWWKLEPQATAAAWAAIDRVIDDARSRIAAAWCVLGLDAPHGCA